MDKGDALESLSVPAYILTQLQAKGKSKISITKCISVGIFSHVFICCSNFIFVSFFQWGPSQWAFTWAAAPPSCFASIVRTGSYSTVAEKCHAWLGCGSCFCAVSFELFLLVRNDSPCPFPALVWNVLWAASLLYLQEPQVISLRGCAFGWCWKRKSVFWVDQPCDLWNHTTIVDKPVKKLFGRSADLTTTVIH